MLLYIELISDYFIPAITTVYNTRNNPGFIINIIL